ncbi:hypothetical protein M947_03695 [Sulfurimonas hongkongensis]|uniref:DUF342 domain-containing protein n=1 Tax=Sulfurimonas hongkongensis TaxID=1172190 RepID=T0JT37_9BACT|nr:flagellar assembly protein A [Sulfurimonas hongkongensis]EQB40137.1 hypothetical protein M947_03695 [Sulfurimonas hongkongensis]
MSKETLKSIKTKNIKAAMSNFAAQNLTPLNECDFEIKETATYIKTSSDDSFRLFNENLYERFEDEASILNNRLQLKQVHTIVPKISTEVTIKLHYTLELSEYKTHPKLILHPDSHILYRSYKPSETYALLVKEFNKIKAKNNIIIGLFDESMLKTLKAFTKHLYEGKFIKKVRIPLFDGIEPEIAKAGKLILWFEQKDLLKKQKVIEVETNEILAEYKKPRYAKSGFNSLGEHINSNYSNGYNDIQTPIDEESIYIEEDEHKKLYRSRCKGFVVLNEKIFGVNNKLKMKKLSRIESSISKQEDNNIEVFVSQSDTTKDSIGEGVELKSEKIHVNGHIGANSILEALDLQIDGATHKDSMQFAKSAMINRHKGTLRCNNAKVALLEGGVVNATNVEIEACLGGTIYAQNVKIGHVKSNLKVYASESIEINLVSGEDNLFKINYKDIPILNSKVELLNEDINKLKDELEDAKRHNISKVQKIQDEIKLLKEEIVTIQNSALRAKITIHKPLKGLNSIVFTLANSQELVYKTQARKYKPFYLNLEDDKITLEPVKKSISL